MQWWAGDGSLLPVRYTKVSEAVDGQRPGVDEGRVGGGAARADDSAGGPARSACCPADGEGVRAALTRDEAEVGGKVLPVCVWARKPSACSMSKARVTTSRSSAGSVMAEGSR